MRLLQSGAFRWVWAGETVSMLGDRVHEIAMAWLVLTLTGSPLTLGAVLAAGAVPRALLLLVGGATSDRLSARVLMLASNLARGLLVGLLVALVIGGWIRLWQLYVIEFAFGVADAFFYPAAAAIPAVLVQKSELPRANALVSTSEQVAMLVGPAVGGVLVALAGTVGAFLLNSLSFFAAAAGLIPAGSAAGSPERKASSLWSDLRQGLAYAFADRELRVVLLLISAASLTYNGVFAVGLPALARHRFPEGSVALGAMLGAWGLGQLLGVLSAGLTGLPRRWGVLIIGIAFAEGAAFIALGLLPTFWAAAAMLAVLAFGVAYSSDVALPTWIQRRSSPDLLGRVMSLVELPRQSLAPLSFLAMGALASFSLPLAFACAGIAMLVAAGVAAGSRTVRELAS